MGYWLGFAAFAFGVWQFLQAVKIREYGLAYLACERAADPPPKRDERLEMMAEASPMVMIAFLIVVNVMANWGVFVLGPSAGLTMFDLGGLQFMLISIGVRFSLGVRYRDSERVRLKEVMSR
ncbi:MAG: hypothetical protein ACFB2Z_07195 [Maricaulaceae bacterium]